LPRRVERPHRPGLLHRRLRRAAGAHAATQYDEGRPGGRPRMSFMDLRQWMTLLEKEGELRRVGAEVHWDRELGAVARRVLEKRGPALLFENVTGYKPGARCTKLFTGGLGDRRRLALALGFPKDVSNAELVQYVMTKNRETLAPRIVKTGPVKDVVVTGAAIDQTEFPVPRWHHLEGGRYIHTFSGIVTRDPDTRVMNVGIYRGMIGKPDTCPMLLIKGGQHWGHHFQKYSDRGQPMPVACVIGWDPIMPFLAGSPIPTGVCEWDVMGAYRGEPAELVKCETVDLEVPASAEIVIEGLIHDDPATWELEGHLHHPPARSDLSRLSRGHPAGLVQREQRDVRRAARRHRLEHPQDRGYS